MHPALQPAFQLARKTLSNSYDAEVGVRALETQVGRRLPEVFRAFLICEGAARFLQAHSNQDHPIALAEMGAGIECKTLLPFMRENQGVCLWAIRLGDQDDPDVLVRVDGSPDWRHAAAHFSEWLWCQVADRQLLDRASFAGHTQPLERSELDAIDRNFSRGPTTFAWPALNNLRLSNDVLSVLLWAGVDQCDWYIRQKEGKTAEDALSELAAFPALVESIYGLNDFHDALLRRWRQGKGERL